MPVTNTTFVRTTIALLIVGFLTVFAIIAASLWVADRTDRFAGELATTMEIRREAFTVLNLLLDAETGQRGYLLTLNEGYLEPYEAARQSIAVEIDQLRYAVTGREEFAASFATLQGRIGDKLAELARSIELARAGRLDEALAGVRSNIGKATMDMIRDSAGDIIAMSNTQIAASTEDVRSSSELLVWLLAGGGLIILSVVGGSAWHAFSYTRDLQSAQREVMSLNATLEQRVRERTGDVARANEEIQRFAYIVSHDLRSPLVNVMGFTSELEAGLAAIKAQLARVPTGDDPVAREARTAIEADMPEAIDFIRASTTKMDRLINAILGLSREGSRRLTAERVDMREVFTSAADSIRHQLDAIGAEIDIAKPLPILHTDRLAVEQVFSNLIDNAVKYLHPDRQGRIAIRARETQLGVEFEIEDNGRGIAAEDHERIFDLFRRAGSQDVPGEGIGLSHVRALVRRMGGTVTVDSELGKGTIFRIKLPQTLPYLRENG